MISPIIILSLSWQHILIVAIVLLLLFGGKKIPELMRGIGRGMREFNDAKNSVKNEIEEGMKEKPTSQSTTVKQES